MNIRILHLRTVKSIPLRDKQEQRRVTGAAQPIPHPALKESGWSTPLPGRFTPGKDPVPIV